MYAAERDDDQPDADPCRPSARACERADGMREERGAEHGQDEPTRVEDAPERQPGRRAQRGEGERCDDARARCHAGFLLGVRPERVNTWFHAVAKGALDASTTTTELVEVSATGCVSTATTLMPASEPRARTTSGPTRPSTAITRSARRCVARFSSTIASRSVECGPTVARRSIDVVTGIAAGAEQLARAGGHLDPALEADEARDDRRHRRRPRPRTTPGRGRRGARRAPPRRGSASAASFWRIMRSPVRAVERQCTRRRSSPSSYSRRVRNSSPRSLHHRARRGQVALAGDPAADRDRRHDVVDARAHEHVAVADARQHPPGETEGVARGERQRADAVAPAAAGGHPVRGAGGRARRERRHQEARRAPTLVEPVGGDEEGTGRGAQVLDPEVDPAVGPHVEPIGLDPPLHRQIGRVPRRQPPRHRGEQRDRGHAEDQHLDGAEQEAPDDEPERRADQRPAAPGERDGEDRCPAHRACSGAGRARHRHRREDRVDDVAARDAAQLRVGRDEHAVLDAPRGRRA